MKRLSFGQKSLGLGAATVFALLGLAAAATANAASDTQSANVRNGGHVTIALSEAPDALDPTTAQTYVSRMVFINTCEALYDINKNQQLVPNLAAAMPRISDHGKTYTIKLRKDLKFNDGTAFNAAAVKKTLERNMHDPRSSRVSSLSSIKSIQIIDPTTVKLKLSHVFAPLTSILSGRAGMIESPAQLKKLGNDFGQHPVCVGPFKFVSRPSDNRIELKKSKYYYDKAKVHLDRVTFEAVTQPDVRAKNLRTGAIDLASRIAPRNAKEINNGSNTRIISNSSLAYEGITLNVSKGNGVGEKTEKLKNTPLAQHPELRQALALSLNRKIINRVVFDGLYTPDCTPIPVNSPYYPANFSCPEYNLAKAKKLVAESGVQTPINVTLTIEAANPLFSKLGQVIQSMAAKAGFHVKLRPMEFTTALSNARAGNFEAFVIGWSGRVDPDQNIAPFWSPNSALNYSGAHYPKIAKLIQAERRTTSKHKRKAVFAKLARRFLAHNNIIYLYHPKYLLGARNDVVGVHYYADQLIRLKTAGLVNK